MLPALPSDARVARRMAFTMIFFEAVGVCVGTAVAYAVNGPWMVGLGLWIGGAVAGYHLGRRVLAVGGHPWPTRSKRERS